ncbi:hypothetical protein GWI33_009894, partial [Rhynchophorus ferrugineus]
MYVTCTFLTTFTQGLMVYYNLDTIKELILNIRTNHLFQVKCKNHLVIAENTKKLLRCLYSIAFVLAGGTQTFWSIKPYIQGTRSLPTKAWYPFDYFKSPYFDITSIYQTITSAYMIVHTINVDVLIDDFIIIIGAQCDMLRYTLQNLNHFESIDGVLVERRAKIDCNDSGFVDVMSENMKICIETYHEIKLLSKISQDMFHLGLFIVSLGGGVILCCILFQLLY